MEDLIKNSIETYNKYAKIYADYTNQKSFQYQINKFITSLPKKAKILDIGCGAGRDVVYFTEENCEAIGIDISEGLLQEARERYPNAKFEKMDFTKTTFPNELFDGLWCMASLSDVPKLKTTEVLNEFNRILKNNGIIFIATKEGEGEKIISKKKYNNSPRFYSFFKEEELHNLLTKTNFEVVSSDVADDSGTKWIEIFARKIA